MSNDRKEEDTDRDTTVSVDTFMNQGHALTQPRYGHHDRMDVVGTGREDIFPAGRKDHIDPDASVHEIEDAK